MERFPPGTDPADLNGHGHEDEDWAETLARRFAHLPAAGLRGVAFAAGSSVVEAFLEQADRGLVDVLRESTKRPESFSVFEEDVSD